MNKISYINSTVLCIGILLFVLGLHSCTKETSWEEELSTFVSLLFDGEFNKAVTSGERAVEIAKEEYGIHSIQVASTYVALGKLYYEHLQDNSKAYVYFDSSLVVQQYSGNKQTDLLPLTLNYLGLLKMKGRDFSSSTEQFFLRAAKGAEVLLHQTDTSNLSLYTDIMVNLAIYYEHINSYEKATDSYEKLIKVREYFNIRDNATLDIYVNLIRTAIEGEKPDYNSARDIAFRVKSILEAAGKAEWRLYIENIGVLGEIYRKEGNYDSAMYYHKQELRLYNESNDAPGMMLAYYHLASIAGDCKRFSIADSLFQEALSLQKKTAHSDIPNRAQIMYSQGVSYMNWGRRAEAYKVFTEVWKLYKEFYGEDDIQTKQARKILDELMYTVE